MRTDDAIDWSLTTWDGARREQVRRWLRLSVRERLEAVDRMGRTAEMLQRIGSRTRPDSQSIPSANPRRGDDSDPKTPEASS